MFCNVAVLSAPYAIYTYALPNYIHAKCIFKGARVAVPLGNGSLRMGVVTDFFEEHSLDEKITIREIVWLLDKKPLLNDELVALAENLSARQGQSIAQIYANILPQAFRTTQKLRIKEFKEKAKPRIYTFKALQHLEHEECARLFDAFYSAYNKEKVELIELAHEKSASELCFLQKDPPWNIRPNALKQRELLEYLHNNGNSSVKIINNYFGKGIQNTLTSLVKAGLIAIQPYEVEDELEEENKKLLSLLESTLLESKVDFTFSDEQTQAIEAGKKVLQSNSSQLRLLYGVTGSGKTAVYLELAKEALLLKRSVFLLAPELSLALKLKKDVEHFLPNIKIYFSHGYQSPIQRAKIYKELAEEEQACFIIGTRSALFHALHTKQNIGFIALDEEHDSSYKQDEKFYYHAKEIALFRAQKHNALMLIASATPDIKTFYAAKQGQIPFNSLLSRAKGTLLPQIELVQMPKSSSSSNSPNSSTSCNELLTEQALLALKDCMQKDEQAVILLNRRGYAPILYCLDCKEVQKCPHCSISLTYHKKKESLTCHYCNYTRAFPSPCAKCKSMHFLPLGDGTEKLEEQLQSFLLKENLDRKILRLDRDSTRRHGSIEEILARFSRKEASILVGTQMLSKGHHFAHVSLAIVADADLTLNFPDYKAAERTFQLLVQSAGRAGRELDNGRVLIQTRDTNHYCWEYVKNHDYLAFYEHELALREKRLYPPFTKLALIRIHFPVSMENSSKTLDIIKNQLKLSSKKYEVRLLGPISSPLAILQNMKRFQCLLKSEQWLQIRQVYNELQKLKAEHKEMNEVRLILDIDPINML